MKFEPLEHGKASNSSMTFLAERFRRTGFRRWSEEFEKRRRAGHLAGFAVTDFRAILYDGKYHDVDSSDMAFRIAGSLAFKEAMKTARPALLEPIMHVEVSAPDQYSGDLMGDLSSRRGRIEGSEVRGHIVIVKALVPLSEMLSYGTDLTSMTQGRASYSMEQSHYDYVPGDMAEKSGCCAQVDAWGSVGGGRGMIAID